MASYNPAPSPTISVWIEADCPSDLVQRIRGLLETGWLQAPGRTAAACPQLIASAQGLRLELPGSSIPPLALDFSHPRQVFRLQRAGQAQEDLLRALGKPGTGKLILDASAGLGRDSLVLAASGCRVLSYERHPVLALMLDDALHRAAEDPRLTALIGRIQLVAGDASTIAPVPTQSIAGVLFDPMFPERGKAAAVKQNMSLLQRFLGAASDLDAAETLQHLRYLTRGRIVVKRPRHAPALGLTPVSGSINGRSIRFDIYPPLFSSGSETGEKIGLG